MKLKGVVRIYFLNLFFMGNGPLHVNLKGILLIICDSLQRSSISFNIENLSLIRDMSLFLSTSVWKYWLKLPSRNNLYTKPDKINITPARNKDAIVIRCITQYRRSCKISINGRSPVEILPWSGQMILFLGWRPPIIPFGNGGSWA